jgi:hypothetical protein
MPVRAKYTLILLLAIAVLLSACGQQATEAPATAIPSETPTPAPTFTSTPDTSLAILVLPADMDQESSDQYQKTVYDLAQASGFRFQVRNTLSVTDVADQTLKVVIVLPPDPGVAALAAAAPQAQFMVVNVPDITAGGNISVLANNADSAASAFLAGYVSAMLTDDYKIGMVLPQGNSDAARAYVAFNNGMIYYCGLCSPFYYSDWTYPQYIEIPADADPATFGAYADILMLQRKVGMLYIYPDVATSALMTYIGTTGVWSITNALPSPRPAGFVMAMQPDTIKAIQSAWPNLIAGVGGANVQSPLGLTGVDSALLTPGKQRLVEQVLLDLIEGRINPLGPQ